MVPTPPPATVAFLNATIGYSRDTCATKLGETTSGQRFLALAAALVTSTGTFHGARAIGMMMERSVLPGTPEGSAPSNQNIDAILKSLVARSLRCGFQDMVATWQVLLKQAVLPRLVSARPPLSASKDPMLEAIPPSEAIAEIVDAFRQVARLGCTSVIGVTIKTETGVAWVLAFAQWCLEIPPSLFVDNEAILDPPGSLIKIEIPTSRSEKSMEVIVHHQLQSLSTLFKPADQYSSNGMVTVETYQKWILSELKLDSPSGQRLLNQVLEYTIPQILSKMTSGKFGRLGRNSDFVTGFVVNDPLDSYRTFLLPDIRKVSDICRLILPQNDPQRFTWLREGLLIEDLPLVKLERDRMRQVCKCKECFQPKNDSPSRNQRYVKCTSDRFLDRFATIIMDIFALSLFERPESVMIRPQRERCPNSLHQSLLDVLESGGQPSCSYEHLVNWAMRMVGHAFDDNGGESSLLVTSSKGQVIYPAIYDTYHLERVGYLRLVNYDGVLNYNGYIYDVVKAESSKWLDANISDLSQTSDSSGERDLETNDTMVPLQPKNLYRTSTVLWDIVANEDRTIEAYLTLRWQGNDSRSLIIPTQSIDALKDTLIYEGCSHSGQTPLTRTDDSIINVPPELNYWSVPSKAPVVRVTCVAGSDSLRFFSLASRNDGTVLRRNACMSCCLSLCRENDISRLIL